MGTWGGGSARVTSDLSGQLELNPAGEIWETIQNTSLIVIPPEGWGSLDVYAPVTKDPCFRDSPRRINSTALPACCSSEKKSSDIRHRQVGPGTWLSLPGGMWLADWRGPRLHALGEPSLSCCLPLLISQAQEVASISDSNSIQGEQAPV